MIGRFEQDSINFFVGSVLQNKANQQRLNLEEFKIKDKNCETEHARIKQRLEELSKNAEEDDEILREILEENRLREEERQRELEEERRQKRDKKKKSKKSSGKKQDL